MKTRKKRCWSIIILTLVIVTITGQSVFATEAESEEAIISDGTSYVVDGLSEKVSLYDPILGMTDNQVIALYEKFSANRANNKSQIDLTEDDLDAFAEYAVKQGVIADTPAQKAALTKALVRSSLMMAANDAAVLGLTTGSACLKHSLQDRPTDVSITVSDPISTQVKNSSACKAIISEFKAYVRSHPLSARTTSGSTTLNSSLDLTLALNRVDYIASGSVNSKGVWTLNITFRDTYDFDNTKWTNVSGLKATTINALNSYGKYAQSIKAVVPYKIKISVKTTFSE